MISLVTIVGLLAALCTTVSYVPQLKKGLANALDRRYFAQDVSHFGGQIALWIIYGVLKRDIVIVLANAVSLLLLSGILFFKLREMWSTNRAGS